MECVTRPSSGLSLHRIFTLHDMEATRCHQIRADFLSGVGPPRPRADAFTALCVAGRGVIRPLNDFATPRDGDLLFQCDFKVHDTLRRWLV